MGARYLMGGKCIHCLFIVYSERSLYLVECAHCPRRIIAQGYIVKGYTSHMRCLHTLYVKSSTGIYLNVYYMMDGGYLLSSHNYMQYFRQYFTIMHPPTIIYHCQSACCIGCITYLHCITTLHCTILHYTTYLRCIKLPSQAAVG